MRGGPRARTARGATSRALWWCALLMASLGIIGCRERTEQRQPEPGARAPLQRPSELLGYWVVPEPAKLWQRLRGRTAATALPNDPRLLVPLWLGLAPTVAGLFSRDAPVVGGVVSSERGPGVLVAVSLESERELRAALTTGTQAPYRAREVGSAVVLEPKTPAADTPALALSSGHLVIGPHVEALARTAPYLTRVIAERERQAPAPRVELDGERAGAFLAASLGAAWADAKTWLEGRARAARAAHGGQQADLAEPEAVIDLVDGHIESLRAALGDIERVKLTAIDDGSPGLELVVEFSPQSSSVSALQGLPTIGRTAHVGASSDAPTVVVLPLGSKAWADTTAAASSVLGLGDDSETHALLAAFGRAADDCLDGPLTVAHARRGEHSAVLLRLGACSESGLDAIMRRVHGILSKPAFSQILSRALGARVAVRLHGRQLSIDAPESARVLQWSFRDSVATVAWARDEGTDGVEWMEERFDRAQAFPMTRLAPNGAPLLFGAAVLLGAPGAASDGWATLAVRRKGRIVTARLEMEPDALQALNHWFDLPDMLEPP